MRVGLGLPHELVLNEQRFQSRLFNPSEKNTESRAYNRASPSI